MIQFLQSNNTAPAPQVLVREKDFFIVYKPPRMHSVPLKKGGGKSLLDWCSKELPETTELPGLRPGEGGFIHRLDYETQGLMLLARTMPGMDSLLSKQKNGKIIKEYSALSSKSDTSLPGFPAEAPPGSAISSAFRPYGPGRKAVRPVVINGGADAGRKPQNREIALSGGLPYVTEILESHSVND